MHFPKTPLITDNATPIVARILAYPWCPATLLRYLRVSAADRAASVERTRITPVGRVPGGGAITRISSGAVIAWSLVRLRGLRAVFVRRCLLVKDERLVDAGKRGAVPHANLNSLRIDCPRAFNSQTGVGLGPYKHEK